MERYHILVSDNLHEKGIELFRARDCCDIDVATDLSPDELKKIIGKYHGLVIRSATKVTADVIAAASNLKVIGRAGAGLDNVDVPDATRRGIVVMNTPGGNSMATAEHTLSLIMAAFRHIPQAVESVKLGKWEKKKFQGHELTGKTLGVIGLGQVGSLVARRASRALRMNVLGYDPVTTPQAASQIGAKLTSLEEIFRRSDVITVHTPLTSETRGLLNAAAFAKMKTGVVVVNCARGGIVDESALLDALESGKVAAASLDVYAVTPPKDNPLVMHPRVIATPHLGASTTEAQINVSVAVAGQIIDYLEKGLVRNAVNAPTIDPSLRPKLEPYLDLAGRLGRFTAQLAPGPIVALETVFCGEIAQWDVKPVTNAVLVGLLSWSEGPDVNDVSAPVIAEKRGIQVSETTSKTSAFYGSTVGIRTSSSDGSTVNVLGALIPRIGMEPRIIGIDDFVTEAVPTGAMLVVANKDVPGMIAGISGALAHSRINIAQMNLSRDKIGGQAMSIINIDTPADEITLESIRGMDGILSVKQVILY
jgi:D-3-phosphoglycerate dehydrogenase